MPIYYGVPLPFQPWFWGLLLASTTIARFYASTVKFYGPFRYGYLKYFSYFAQFYNPLLDWWLVTASILIFSNILLSIFLFGLIFTTFGAWLYIYHEYSEDLRKITDEVGESMAKASLAANSACEYVITADRYETAIISAAVGTRRDALIASSVRTTDFFHTATEAWAALGTVTQPAGDARAKAAELVSKAFDIDELDKPDEESGRSAVLAEYLHEKSPEALKLAEQVEAKLHVAQESVRKSHIAEQKDQEARDKAKANASAAAKAAKNLAELIKKVPDTKHAAEGGAENARRFGAQAIAAATEGEMARARRAAELSKQEGDSAVKSMTTLREAMRGAHRVLLEWLEKESS